MKRTSRSAWVCVLIAAVSVPGAQGVLGDVLIAQNGTRYEGKVTDRGDNYLLELKGGTSISLPKTVIRSVLITGQSRAEFQKMLGASNLANDVHVAMLVKFTSENELKEEQKDLLASAYQVRRRLAEAKPDALRAVAAWSRKYGLEAEAAECNNQAELCDNQAEFQKRFADVGKDPKHLEELARWCKERNMAAEVAQCLSDDYEDRRGNAETPDGKWSLARWCGQWGMTRRRDEERSAAIQAVARLEDVATLSGYLEELRKEGDTSEISATCARAIYRLRSKAAGNNALELARLSAWCREQMLAAEEAEAGAAAVRVAPEDVQVREILGYFRDQTTGQWAKSVMGEFDVETFNRGEYDNKRVRWRGMVKEVRLGSLPVVCVAIPTRNEKVEMEVRLECQGEIAPAVKKGRTVIYEGIFQPGALTGATYMGNVLEHASYTFTLKNARIVAVQ